MILCLETESRNYGNTEIRNHGIMEIIDIHTHVLPEIPGTALVCIGCGPLPQDKGHLFSAGLHPWYVTGSDEESFRNLGQLLELPQVLAVGECGLDTLKGPAHELQEQALLRQLELSEQYGKPVVLHVVRDFDSIIRLHKQLKPKQKWIIHGFRGGPDLMNQILSKGILVSFGLKHNPESLKKVPSHRLFLETDGNCSIAQVIQTAAAERGVPAACIERLVQTNISHFLRINQ